MMLLGIPPLEGALVDDALAVIGTLLDDALAVIGTLLDDALAVVDALLEDELAIVGRLVDNALAVVDALADDALAALREDCELLALLDETSDEVEETGDNESDSEVVDKEELDSGYAVGPVLVVLGANARELSNEELRELEDKLVADIADIEIEVAAGEE